MCGADGLASIIIPSYGSGRALLKLVDVLLRDEYPLKEVIVVLDEPAEGLVEELARRGVKLVVRERRRGKASALNEGVRRARGDVLIFLDDDAVPAGSSFVRKIVEELRDCDICELRKVIVGKGLLARMVYYDYVGYNYGSLLFARRLGKCIALNGAAFAMRREAFEKVGGFKPTISEDLKLGLDSYLNGLRFKFLLEPFVMNYPPSGWRSWLKQRIRWGVGAAVWVRENWQLLLALIKRDPALVLLVVMLLLPALASLVAALLASPILAEKLAWLALVYASYYYPPAAFLATILSYKMLCTTIRTLVVALASFAAYVASYLKAARAVRMKFSLPEFALYFFAYSPLWLTILLAGFVRVFLLGKTDVKDWPVERGPTQ